MHTMVSVWGSPSRRGGLETTATSATRQGGLPRQPRNWNSRGRRDERGARGARSGYRPATQAASEHVPDPPSDDPIDKFLYRLRTYVRHPGRAVSDFAGFAVDSCRLMAHVSKPSPLETVKTALIVLVVVALFVGLLHASNVGLLTVRSVGEHLLQLRHR